MRLGRLLTIAAAVTLAVPAAAATLYGTTYTGDVDTYVLDGHRATPTNPPALADWLKRGIVELCPAVIYTEFARLTLLDAEPGDSALLAVDGHGAAVATHDSPAEVTWQDGGCGEAESARVVGLVTSGVVSYRFDEG